ncbi:hypothetical protein [Amycolatopsis sp. NPDC051371]
MAPPSATTSRGPHHHLPSLAADVVEESLRKVLVLDGGMAPERVD